MADAKTCPHCGKPVPPTSLGGICPECMLKAGLAAQTEGSGATGPHGTKVVQPPPTPAEIASLFPQLEILECLGRGGMGVVYKARQPRLNRLVALKILARDKEQDAPFAERFAREAQALARLSHPNIVAVHDFGEAGGHCYLVMEFVDGLNLRQLLQTGKIKPEQALAIVPKICEALQYAHEQGIVHRDIKPENILLDKQGRVKIADFGIAKMLGAEAGQQTLTGARDAVGTPHYMAPEQIEKPLTVDHRADIYSLGVVFYEMLTGELPLGKFQPPSQKVQVDVRLDEVVLRALEKEPERRYQQASEIKTRVETITQTPPVAGAAPNVTAFTEAALARDYQLNIGHCLSRGWKLVADNFWPVVGVAALVGLLQNAANSSLIGVVVSGPLAGGLWLFFLKKIRGETVKVGTAFSGFTVAFVPLFLGGLVKCLLILAGFICLLLPGIYLEVALAFTLMLIADKGLDFWPAMGLSRKVVSKHWWKFLWFFILLAAIELAGLLACLIGIFVGAPVAMAALAYAYEDIFGPAAEAADQVPAGAPVAAPRSGGGWGTAVGIAAGAAAAVLLVAILGLLAAIAIPNFVRARQHSQQAAAQQWIQQGWQLWQSGKLAEAEGKFQQAVRLAPRDANAWNGLGWAEFNSGNSQEAEKAFEKAISLDTNQPGALNGLGQIYLSQGKYYLAEMILLKAAPQAPAAWNGLTRLYLLEGKYKQAEKWAQDLIDAGQADDLVRQMLEAAQEKHLSEGLRFRILPPATRSGNTNSSASAETWSPTLAPDQKPDLQKILDSAKSLTGEGSYEEALQRYLWYFDHSRNDAGQRGVRLSFALSNWIELGRRYPKARQALMEIRDADVRQFSEDDGYSDLFQEIAGINQYLNDNAATVALFKTIETRDAPLAGQCYPFVQSLLVQQGEYEECLRYLGDPQAAFERIRQSRERLKQFEEQNVERSEELRKRFQAMATTNPAFARPPFMPEPPKFADDNFVGQTRQLIEILVGVGEIGDAEKIRDQALTVLNAPKLKSAVDDAQQTIVNKHRGILGTITNLSQGTVQILPGRTPNAATIDSATGLPTASGGRVMIDPATGLPMSPAGTRTIDPATGLPVTPSARNGATNAVGD